MERYKPIQLYELESITNISSLIRVFMICTLKKRKPLWIVLFPVLLLACKRTQIKHVNILREAESISVNGHHQKNRIDYFIIYKSLISSVSKPLVEATIKPYVDSFSTTYNNYTILLYNESRGADTLYIKSFGEGYYYKALLGEAPYMEFSWWAGKLLKSPF